MSSLAVKPSKKHAPEKTPRRRKRRSTTTVVRRVKKRKRSLCKFVPLLISLILLVVALALFGGHWWQRDAEIGGRAGPVTSPEQLDPIFFPNVAAAEEHVLEQLTGVTAADRLLQLRENSVWQASDVDERGFQVFYPDLSPTIRDACGNGPVFVFEKMDDGLRLAFQSGEQESVKQVKLVGERDGSVLLAGYIENRSGETSIGPAVYRMTAGTSAFIPKDPKTR